MLQALGEAASDNNTSTNVVHDQDDLDHYLDENQQLELAERLTDDLLGVPDNDSGNAFLDNDSVLPCDSDDSFADLPNTETADALSSHMPLHASSSDAVGCSNEKTVLPQLPDTETAGPDPVRSIVFLRFWRAYAVTPAVYI